MGNYQVGDAVVYQVDKHSTRPGPRAKDVYATPKGEYYSYSVDKFWRVSKILEDGRLRLNTRRGKEHIVSPTDARLRKASLWERLMYRRKFPVPAVETTTSAGS